MDAQSLPVERTYKIDFSLHGLKDMILAIFKMSPQQRDMSDGKTFYLQSMMWTPSARYHVYERASNR